MSQIFQRRPLTASKRDDRLFDLVLRTWTTWRREHPADPAEAFLDAPAAQPLRLAITRFVAARLSEPDQVRLEHELRYGERLTKPSPSPLHHAFASHVDDLWQLAGIVTTNYDLLAERTWRHRPMLRPPRRGIHYAGLSPRPLKGSSTFSVEHAWVTLTGEVPLCKLHGSLNWIWEPAGGITAYADCRPAFWGGKPSSLIVPPKPEKQIDPRLWPIWNVAGSVLAGSDVWLIVGYSVPLYDGAVLSLLKSATAISSPHVHVINPDPEVVSRVQSNLRVSTDWHRNIDSFVVQCRRTNERIAAADVEEAERGD